MTSPQEKIPHAPGVSLSVYNTIAGRNVRYRSITDAKILEVADEMAKGFSLPASCGKVGVSVDALRVHLQKWPEAQQIIDMGKLKRVHALEKVLLATGSKMPQVASRIFALKNADPENWQERPAFTPGLNQNIVIITGVPEAINDPRVIQSLINHIPVDHVPPDPNHIEPREIEQPKLKAARNLKEFEKT